MNRLPFTKYASKALNEGREIAGYLGFKDVSSIFILLGLYGADGSLASEVLKMHGVKRINRRSDQRKVKDAKGPQKDSQGHTEDRISSGDRRRDCNEIWLRFYRIRAYFDGNDQRWR